MRVKNSTQRLTAFVQNLQESFWGDFQGQTRQRLRELLEKDAEQQMAEYLGLKWHERAKPSERVDYRNGFYQRSYVTAWGRSQCAFRELACVLFCRAAWSRCSGARRKSPN